MVIVIKSGSSKEEIEKALKKLDKNAKKGFNAQKFSGILNLEEDPLKIQKKLRDEWE